MRWIVVAACLLTACGKHDLPPPELPPFPEAEQPAPRPPPGTLWREDVNAVLDGGLGRFLQQVSVDPYLEAGAFVGWEIMDLRPAEDWADVDLRPGDIVTAINGQPIERDSQALAAFESLREAKELRVAYVRDGRGRELVFAIRPRSSGANSKSAPAAVSPKPNSSKPGPAKAEAPAKPPASKPSSAGPSPSGAAGPAAETK